MKDRNRIKKTLLALGVVVISALGVSAQNSLPAPGSGGGFNPAPNGPMGPGAPGGSGPAPVAPSPGGPGGPGWNGGPGPGIGISFNIGGGFANQGTVNVVGCGYDNMGNYRTIPMTVSYTYSYGQYDVTVLSAYNPFTMMWMNGIDAPAYNTSYFLRGQTFNFYVPLSTGTYYFNL